MRVWGWPVLLIAMVLAIGVEALFDVAAIEERALFREIAFREGRTAGAMIETTQWVTWAGDAAQRSVVMVAFAAWLFLRRKRPRAALAMLVTVPLAGVTASLLKEAFSRPRPSVVPHLDLVTSFSYPSGHAANAMVVLLLGALLLARRGRGLWIALAILTALVIGVSRTLLGVHYPTDLLGGWLLGIAFALAGWRVASRLEANGPVRDEPPALSPAQSPEPLARSDEPHPSTAAPGSQPPPA